MDTAIPEEDKSSPFAGSERLFDVCFDAARTDICPSSEKVTMFAAIAANNKAKVLDILEVGFPVNESLSPQPGNITTALHAAIVYGREEIVEVLLNWGGDAHKGRDDGFSPAKLIYQFGDVVMLQRLLRWGGCLLKADTLPPKSRSGDEQKAAHCRLDRLCQAIRDNNDALVQREVNDPELMESTDCFGRSPIAYAAMLGRVKYVRQMLSSDSRSRLPLSARSLKTVSALQWALLRGHAEIAKLILGEGAERCGLLKPECLAKMVYTAALANNVTVLQHLHKTCAAAKKTFKLDNDALWPIVRDAVALSSTGIVKELLSFFGEAAVLSSSPTTSTCPQASVLGHAIQCSRPTMVEAILNAGAPADKKLPDGSTPLEKALKQADPTIVRLLLAHGAAVFQRDEKIRKFLQRATTPSLRPTSKERKCAKLLLDLNGKMTINFGKLSKSFATLCDTKL